MTGLVPFGALRSVGGVPGLLPRAIGLEPGSALAVWIVTIDHALRRGQFQAA